MEQIDIASLNFDTDKLNKSALDTRLKIDELASSISAIRKTNREAQKSVEALTKVNEALAESGEKNSEAYKENEKSIEQLNKKIEENTKDLVKNESTRRNLNKEQRELNKILDLQTKSQSDNTIAVEASTLALNKEWTTQQEAFDSGKAMMALRKQLNPTIEEEAKLMEQLASRIDEANDFQDLYNTKNEDRTKGIGKYKDAITQAIREQGLFNSTTSAGTSGASGFTSGITGAIGGMKGLTGATTTFTAIPLIAIISALVKGFQFLYKRFGETQEGLDRITAVTKPLMAVFDQLLGIIQSLAVGVGEGLTKAFKDPLGAMKELGDYIKDNLINRIKGFAVIYEAILDRDFKGIADGFIQINTGITDATDKIKGFADGMSEAYDRGAEVDRLTKEINRNEAALLKAQKESALEIEKITEQLRDGNKTYAERKELAEQRLAVEEKQAAMDLAHLNMRAELMRLENEGSATLLEDETEYQALLSQRTDIEMDVQRIRTRNRRFISGAEKEEQQAQAEAHKEVMRGILDKQKAELDLFILRNEGNQSTMQEEVDFYRDIQNQKEAILKQQLKSNVITQLEYNTEIEKLAIESAKQEAEITLFYATQKLNEEIKTLQEVQNERKRFNDETFEAEQELINRISEEQLINAKERLDSGLINRHEYNDLVLELETEHQNKLSEIDKLYEQQRVDDRKLTRLLEHEAVLLGMEDSFEAEQELLNFFHEQEQERLADEYEQGLISEENYLRALDNLNKDFANSQMKLDAMVAENKMQTYSDALGNVSKILGETTTAGKFFASAQAGMDTYVAANKALAAYPPPFSYIAAAATIASGLGNVAKINSTKTNKSKGQFYTGGFTGDGGMFTRTGYTHAGEVVFNQADVVALGGANAVERLRPTSNQFGQMPTGVTGGNDMSNWHEIGVILGQYTREGTMEGSSNGIERLTDNVDVKRSAIF